MNTLVIPPCPNWYESSILACAPDNTLVYGAKDCIVVIHNTSENEAAKIEIITRAHTLKILSVSLNRKWGNPFKYCVSVSEDKVVTLWDIEKCERKLGHDGHVANNEKVIGANFASEERIVSVSESGLIIIWHFSTNEQIILKDLFGPKVNITALSTCPHVSWLASFGTKNGLVYVVDLRRSGRLLHKLRGHEKAIIALSWCPVPYNIFPRNPGNTVAINSSTNANYKNKQGEESVTASSESTENPTETIDNEKESNKIPSESNEGLDSCEPVVKTVDETSTVSNDETLTDNATCEEGRQICTSDHIEKVNNEKESDKIPSENNEELESNESVAKTLIETITVLNEGTVTNKENCKEHTNTSLGDNIKTPADNVDLEPHAYVDTIEKTDENKSDDSNEVDKNCTAENLDTCKNNETEISELRNESDENNPNSENLGSHVNTQTEAVHSENKTDESKIIVVAKQTDLDCETKQSERTIIQSEEELPRRECLLASSGKDGAIYIWRAGTDGRLQTFMSVPKLGRTKNSPDKCWITVHWIAPNSLLSSSRKSSLLEWRLPKPVTNCPPKVIHNDHHINLFAIAGPFRYYDNQNVDISSLNVWTLGQDRLLLNTSLDTSRKNLACYSTLGGCVTCFATSPIDPARLAIGLGYGAVKVWDLSKPHVKHVNTLDFHNKIQSKVTALAWHPENEFLLAFGTVEGRIGHIDTANPAKAPLLYPQFFQSAIYKLEWGPMKNETGFHLYVTSDGKVVIYNSIKWTDEPVPIELPNKLLAYSMSWKPDFKYLLISSRCGVLLVYSRELELLKMMYLHLKGFHLMVWHPDAVKSDSFEFPRCNWFTAVELASEKVYIYDIAQLMKSGAQEGEDDCDKSKGDCDIDQKPVIVFESHVEMVNDLAWDPFDGTKLVSVGDDGFSQVWNVETNTALATYVTPHYDSINSVIWSPLDPDYIIIGNRSNFITIWKISEHPAKNSEEFLKRKAEVKAIKKEAFEFLPKPEKSEQLNDLKIQPKYKLLPNIKKGLEQAVRNLIGKAKGDHQEEINGETMLEKLFGKNEDIMELLNTQEKNLQEKGKTDNLTLVSLWKGDIGDAIKKAVEETSVTPWMISLAPMVSPKLWQDACLAYAEAQSDLPNCDPFLVASYYLACHKVEKAVKVLCINGMHKEALALAKSRLPENDPLINEVVTSWSKSAYYNGDYEMAAFCSIVMGNYEGAAKCLSRRNDDSLKIAGELAELAGNHQLKDAIKAKYKTICNTTNTEDISLPTRAELYLKNSEIDVLNIESNPQEQDLESKLLDAVPLSEEINSEDKHKITEEKPNSCELKTKEDKNSIDKCTEEKSDNREFNEENEKITESCSFKTEDLKSDRSSEKN